MAKSANLGAAKNAKQDEFYTQLSDIEKEMRHYRRHFKDKTILCNCDDPFESNFFKFFVLNFNRLGLKKVIATCYSGSPIAGKQLSLFDVLGDSAETRNKPYKPETLISMSLKVPIRRSMRKAFLIQRQDASNSEIAVGIQASI